MRSSRVSFRCGRPDSPSRRMWPGRVSSGDIMLTRTATAGISAGRAHPDRSPAPLPCAAPAPRTNRPLADPGCAVAGNLGQVIQPDVALDLPRKPPDVGPGHAVEGEEVPV